MKSNRKYMAAIAMLAVMLATVFVAMGGVNGYEPVSETDGATDSSLSSSVSNGFNKPTVVNNVVFLHNTNLMVVHDYTSGYKLDEQSFGNDAIITYSDNAWSLGISKYTTIVLMDGPGDIEITITGGDISEGAIYAGTSQNSSSDIGRATINVTGGKVGAIYGGAYYYNSGYSYTESVVINVSGGEVGSIFGTSEGYYGARTETSAINVTGGTVGLVSTLYSGGSLNYYELNISGTFTTVGKVVLGSFGNKTSRFDYNSNIDDLNYAKICIDKDVVSDVYIGAGIYSTNPLSRISLNIEYDGVITVGELIKTKDVKLGSYDAVMKNTNAIRAVYSIGYYSYIDLCESVQFDFLDLSMIYLENENISINIGKKSYLAGYYITRDTEIKLDINDTSGKSPAFIMKLEGYVCLGCEGSSALVINKDVNDNSRINNFVLVNGGCIEIEDGVMVTACIGNVLYEYNSFSSYYLSYEGRLYLENFSGRQLTIASYYTGEYTGRGGIDGINWRTAADYYYNAITVTGTVDTATYVEVLGAVSFGLKIRTNDYPLTINCNMTVDSEYGLVSSNAANSVASLKNKLYFDNVIVNDDYTLTTDDDLEVTIDNLYSNGYTYLKGFVMKTNDAVIQGKNNSHIWFMTFYSDHGANFNYPVEVTRLITGLSGSGSKGNVTFVHADRSYSEGSYAFEFNNGYAILGGITAYPTTKVYVSYDESVNIPNENDYYTFTSVEKGIKVTVTLVDPNSTELNTLDVMFGGKYTGLETPTTQRGVTFMGWYTEPHGGTEVTANSDVLNSFDHILYARYMVDVTFIYSGGGTDKISYEYGAEYGYLPSTKMSEEYLPGWYTSGTIDSAELVLVTSTVDCGTIPLQPIALYEWAKIVKITFVNPEGDNIVVKKRYLVDDYDIEQPTLSENFQGEWYVKDSEGNYTLVLSDVVCENVKISEDHFVYPYYLVDVTFTDENGVTITTGQYTFLQKFGSLPEHSEGKFAWYTNFSGMSVIVTEDTIVANYEDFTVTEAKPVSAVYADEAELLKSILGDSVVNGDSITNDDRSKYTPVAKKPGDSKKVIAPNGAIFRYWVDEYGEILDLYTVFDEDTIVEAVYYDKGYKEQQSEYDAKITVKGEVSEDGTSVVITPTITIKGTDSGKECIYTDNDKLVYVISCTTEDGKVNYVKGQIKVKNNGLAIAGKVQSIAISSNVRYVSFAMYSVIDENDYSLIGETTIEVCVMSMKYYEPLFEDKNKYFYKLCTVGSAVGKLPTPEVKGYDFNGWYCGNTELTSSTIFSKEWAKVVADQTVKQYTVTYVIQWYDQSGEYVGSNVFATEKATPGTTLYARSPLVLSGYTTSGLWSYKGAPTETITMPEENVTFYVNATMNP